MKLLITSALLFLAVSPLAQAHHSHSYYDNDKYNRGVFKAKVIHSTPKYRYVTVNHPQTYCEPVVVRKTHRHSHNKGAAIVGGVVGGVIGHAASNNKHKGLGTVIGAVIGSSLAHNIERANNKHTRSYQVHQQNCVATNTHTSKVRVLDGYNVTYRSQGRIYRTFSQDKPAKYIHIYY